MLSSFYNPMLKLKENEYTNWETTLIGNRALETLPMSDSTFNMSLDNIMSNPNGLSLSLARCLSLYSKDLISRAKEICRHTKYLLTASDFHRDYNANSKIKNIEEVLSIMCDQMNNRDDNKLVDNSINNNFSWTTLSMLTSPYHRVSNFFGKDHSDIYFSSLDDLSVEMDMVYETIDNVPIFKNTLIEATKAIYEMCIIVSVLSIDRSARMSARTMIKWLSANSPVLKFLDLSSTHSLIALLAKPSQYKTFLSVIEKQKRHRRYPSSCFSRVKDDNIDFEFYKQLYEDFPDIFRDDENNADEYPL